jgi:Zn-dependent protease
MLLVTGEGKLTVLVVAILVLSVAIHEVGHAWMALRCGDTTARDMGRLTLNPIAHIDPFWSILLPAVLFYTVGFPFGGAKPVPVVASRLRHPLRDMMWVALAGPISNVLQAIVWAAVRHGLLKWGILEGDQIGAVALEYAVLLNLILAVFNMIPIPPLDGSRVAAYFLPTRVREQYVALESVGMLLVMALVIFTNVLSRIIWPGVSFLFGWVEWIATLGGAW